MNIKQQLQASVAAESECSMVHDRFGVTLMGPRANVLRALAALEIASRHEPRPAPQGLCAPLVRLGQGALTRDYTPIAESVAERIDASKSQAPAPGTDPSRRNPPGA